MLVKYGGNHTSIIMEYADVPWISSKTTISLSIFGVTLNDECPTTPVLPVLQLVRGPPAAQHNLEILEDTYVHNIFTLFLLETGFSPITERTLLGSYSFTGISTLEVLVLQESSKPHTDDRITHASSSGYRL